MPSTHSDTNTKATALVHHTGEEGSLQINLLSGAILTPPDERPDWCDGLVRALTGERLHFYATRLGPVAGTVDAITAPDLIDYADLGWLATDAEGSLIEIDADPEFRMEALSSGIGMTRPDTLDERPVHTSGRVLAEYDALPNPEMGEDEARALEDASNTSPGVRATGT